MEVNVHELSISSFNLSFFIFESVFDFSCVDIFHFSLFIFDSSIATVIDISKMKHENEKYQ